MGDVNIEVVDEEKDLGVKVDNELSFDSHIEGQVNKANKLLGLIRRSFDNLEAETFTILYKSLVRPILEYCNVVAHPQFERQRKLLEGVQRRATRMVPQLRGLDYIQRLEKLKLPSLYYRRARGDIIEAYKYLHGLYQVDPCPLEIDQKGNTRGNSLKLLKKRHEKAVRKNFFTYRVVNPWNKLPDEVVLAPTINTLKNRLDKHWQKFHYTLDSDIV